MGSDILYLRTCLILEKETETGANCSDAALNSFEAFTSLSGHRESVAVVYQLGIKPLRTNDL
jgi:hypothetical protein